MDNTNAEPKLNNEVDHYDDDIFDLGGIDWLDEIEKPPRELQRRRERLEDFPDKIDQPDESKNVSRHNREIIRKNTPKIFYVQNGKSEKRKDQVVTIFGKRVPTRSLSLKYVEKNEKSGKIGGYCKRDEKAAPKIIRLRKSLVSDVDPRINNHSIKSDETVQGKTSSNAALLSPVNPECLPSPVGAQNIQWPPKPPETCAKAQNIQWPPKPPEICAQEQDVQWPPKPPETGVMLDDLKASALELLLKLSFRHPRLFPQDGTIPRPWMIGIAGQIKSRYRVSGRVANLALNIYLWQNRARYAQAMANGGARYDLDGIVCGQVVYQPGEENCLY